MSATVVNARLHDWSAHFPAIALRAYSLLQSGSKSCVAPMGIDIQASLLQNRGVCAALLFSQSATFAVTESSACHFLIIVTRWWMM